MSKKTNAFFPTLLALVLSLSLVTVAFGAGFFVATGGAATLSGTPVDPVYVDGPLAVFKESWDLIEQDFYGPLPPNDRRVYSAIRSMLATLDDPYTVFVEPIPHQFEQDDLRGSYGGVGVTLARDEAGRVVLSPFRDSPAAQAGIQEGDVLLKVDDIVITADMDISQDIVARIRGEVGTEVALTIERGGERLVFVITRQAIEIPSVNWRMLDEAPTLGYIQISSFTDRTAGELETALSELFPAGARGLILDLRDNGGGLLQSSIDVADQFLDGGAVLYEARKGDPERMYEVKPGGLALETPLVVLVNHGTASAAEIVAGAIQDRGRGQLVGETTFGKGSVQLIFELSDGSSLHVTAARWFTPNRHQLDGVGLTPEVIVPAEPDAGRDVQLEQAISLLLSDS